MPAKCTEHLLAPGHVGWVSGVEGLISPRTFHVDSNDSINPGHVGFLWNHLESLNLHFWMTSLTRPSAI